MEGKKIINYKQLLLFVLAFAFVITICGTAAAATPQQNTTINSHNNSSTLSTLQTNSKKATSKAKNTSPIADPIITGTVTINEYGHIRVLKGATVTVNSTASNSKVLGTTKTDQNGHYSINFYSTDPQYRVTSSYIGCNNITQTVTVSQGPNYPTDPNYYGTANIELTPKIATLTGTGNGRNIYIQGENKLGFAGVINVRVDGTTYQANCIDLFTPISIGDTLLVNGPLPGTAGDLPSEVDWGKVTYVLNNYNPSSNDEAAAIQCAIWYFTSVHYGPYGGPNPVPDYYQFMTAPNDGRIDGAYGSTTVRTRAWEIINAAVSVKYPNSITLSPETTKISNGQSATVTATVKDRDGNPLQGITVNFQSDKGNLDHTSGITNALGQVSITLSSIPNFSSAIVTAFVSGNYGNLLYDDQYTTRKQNLAARNLLPLTLSDISVINTDVTANVALSQTANSPVNVGDTVTYRVTATNNGPNAATGIMIMDILPAGLNGFTVTPSVGTYYNNVWVIPSLANGATATLTITGTATASMAGTTKTNTATRTTQEQYNSLSPVTSADVFIKPDPVDIRVKQFPWYYNADTKTYQYTYQYSNTPVFTTQIKNLGPDDATNVQIQYIIGNGLKYEGYSTTAGTVTRNGNILTWNIDYMPQNGIVNMKVFTTIIESGTQTPNLTNTATLTSVDQEELNIDNNQATCSLTVPIAADIGVIQDNPIINNSQVRIIIHTKNNGPNTATDVQINDILPTGLTFQSAEMDIGTYNPITGIWNIGTLNNGQTGTLTLLASITGTGTIKNTANTNRDDAIEFNWNLDNDAQTRIIQNSGYNPTVDIRVKQFPWYYNADTKTYQYTYQYSNTPVFTTQIKNLGPDDATNVQIQYIIGNGLKYEGYSTTAGTVTRNGNILTWNIDYMPQNGIVNMKVFTTIIESGTQTPNLTNTATLTSVDQEELNIDNNQATCSLTVPIAADIGVTQVYRTFIDNDILYSIITITTINNGPNTATNVQINDILPTGLTFQSAEMDIGTYNPITGIWNIGTLNNGEEKTLTITTLIAQDVMNTVYTNRDDAIEFDWNLDNNSQLSQILSRPNPS